MQRREGILKQEVLMAGPKIVLEAVLILMMI
jgi:hypothetical protein